MLLWLNSHDRNKKEPPLICEGIFGFFRNKILVAILFYNVFLFRNQFYALKSHNCENSNYTTVMLIVRVQKCIWCILLRCISFFFSYRRPRSKCHGWNMARWIFLLLCLMESLASDSDSVCPRQCDCKWKRGKESVFCSQTGFYQVPKLFYTGTQVDNSFFFFLKKKTKIDVRLLLNTFSSKMGM